MQSAFSKSRVNSVSIDLLVSRT